MTPVLEARDLVFRHHGDGGGLDGVSLTLHRGRRTALLGPNGAGKSTLLLHLNGLAAPSRGEVRLHGDVMTRDASTLTRWRRSVGLVFQHADDQLFGPTVADDVASGPRNLGLADDAARQRALEALAELGLSHLAARPVHALSAGEKRRVALAGVIAMHPAVLLLDEPTAGLDPDAEGRLLDALERLASAGVSLLMATHDVALARAWADDVVVLVDGRVAAAGSIESLTPSVLADAHLVRAWTRQRSHEAISEGASA